MRFCLQIIFADECTEAENKCWHMKHFRCFDCDAQLGGQRYVTKEDMPYCCECFERRFSDFCVTCGGQIGVDQGQMTHGGLHWHATVECFRCATCNRVLLGHPFLPKNQATYCSVDCSRGITVHNSFVDSAVDSLQSSSSMGKPKLKFEDPWILQENMRQENCSEGYGSLQKPINSFQRSLPDLTTCDEYSDYEVPQFSKITRNRAGSERNLKNLNKHHGKIQRQPSAKQKCVKWANDQMKAQTPENSRLNSIIRPQTTRSISMPPTNSKSTGGKQRKHRTKRMSRSQRERLALRRSTSPPQDHNDSCSTCSSCSSGSSSEESDLEDAYQADIIRSGGIRVARADGLVLPVRKSKKSAKTKRAKQHKTKNCVVQ